MEPRTEDLPGNHQVGTSRLASSSQKDTAIGYIFSREVFGKNFAVALVVGTLLSLINQLDVILRQPVSAAVFLKIGLNFVIPFTVSSLSAALNRNCD